MLTSKQAINYFGWYGVISILIAYFLTNFGYMRTDNVLYLLLNITGSLAIIFDAYKDRNYQPVILNIVWLLIAIISLIRIWI